MCDHPIHSPLVHITDHSPFDTSAYPPQNEIIDGQVLAYVYHIYFRSIYILFDTLSFLQKDKFVS